MNDNILIFGKGYIGKRLYEDLKCKITEKKIINFSDADEEIKKHKPEIIINCIGYTGQGNVDDCEKDKEKTLLSNSFVPVILAECAVRYNIKLLHISTGCIFHYDYSKNMPVSEEIIPDYLKLFYSRSKIYAENALKVLINKNNILIVRPRVFLDKIPHPKNVLTKLLSFDKIINCKNSVVYLPDFISMVKHLIKIDAKGIYNTVNKGALEYSFLLKECQKYMTVKQHSFVNPEELNINRTNLLMSVEKLKNTGFKVRHINDAVKECVKEYASLI